MNRSFAAVLSGCLLWASSAAVAGSAECVSLTIRRAAIVYDDVIRIGHVVELVGSAPQLLSRISAVEVAASPLPQQRRYITATQIEHALAKSGFNLGRIRLQGASSCLVTRLDREDAERLRRAKRRHGGGVSLNRPARLRPVTGRRTLRQVLLQAAAAQSGLCPQKLQMQILRTDAMLLELSEPACQFIVKPLSISRLGTLSFSVQIYQNQQLRHSLTVPVQVRAMVEQVVAVRDLPAGHTVKPQDVQMRRVAVSDLSRVGLRDCAAAVGQRTRHAVRSGQVLYARDLRPVPLVRRNSLVTVWLRQRNLQIRTVGRAQQDGFYGQTVVVTNESSGRKYVATVVGPDTVQTGYAPAGDSQQQRNDGRQLAAAAEKAAQ